MEPFFAAYLEWLEKLHDEIKQALNGLPQEALDWTPGPEMNSIAVLAVHVAGAERYWIGDVALQEASGRDRPAEFATVGIDAHTLAQRLDDSLAYARIGLTGLRASELADARTSSRHERTFTLASSLLHALEHTAQHAGHIGLTRQLWQQQAENG